MTNIPFAEVGVTAAVLRDPAGAIKMLNTVGLDWRHFSSPESSAVVLSATRMLLDGTPPTPLNIMAAVMEASRGRFDEQDLADILKVSQETQPIDLAGHLERVKTLANHRKFESLVQQYQDITSINPMDAKSAQAAILQSLQAMVVGRTEESPDAKNKLEQWAQMPTRTVFTGVGILDEWLGGGLKVGRTTVIGAPSGNGKTTMCITLLANCVLQEIHAIYFSTEMLPAMVIVPVVFAVTKSRGVFFHKDEIESYCRSYAEGSDDNIPPPVLEAIHDVRRLTRWYDGQVRASDMISRVRVHAAETNGNLGLVIVDHIHRMQFENNSRQSKTNELYGEMVNLLDKASRDYAVSMVLMAQVAQSTESEWFKTGRFNGAAFKESGEILNVAYHAMIIARDLHNSALMRCFIKKDRDAGRIGQVEFAYDRTTGTYADVLPLPETVGKPLFA